MKLSEIVVTGSSGFLGTALCQELSNLGYYVLGIDKVKPAWTPRGMMFIKKDISESNSLRKHIENRIVIHCAASVPITRVGFLGHLKNNLVGTANVVKANPQKIIFISSSAVYGSPNGKIDDTTRFNSIEEYGNSKVLAELKLLINYRINKVPTIIIRPRTIIGNARMGMMDFLFPRIMKNKPVYLIGSGNNKFQLLSLDDLIDCIIKSITYNKKGYLELNVGTDIYSTLRKDIEFMISVVGSKSKVISLPKASRWILRVLDKLNLSPMTRWHYDTTFNDFEFDLSTVKRELGWIPNDSNASMLIDAYLWYAKGDKEGDTPHTKKLNKRLLEMF